jgi:hypothetical protein
MVAARIWTNEQDDTIRRMRAEGSTWKQIAQAFGVNIDVLRFHAGKIGASLGTVQMFAKRERTWGGPNRNTLPAFHPITWGILVQQTPSLQNTLYKPRNSP